MRTQTRRTGTSGHGRIWARRWLGAAVAACLLALGAAGALAASTPRFSATPRAAPRSTAFLVRKQYSGPFDQVSVRDGRVLGVAVRTPPATAANVSLPHRAADGALWLTASTGPRDASPFTGPHTCPAGGCPTKPDSCGGIVARVDPVTHRTRTEFVPPPSVLVRDAVPDRESRRIAYVERKCGNTSFNAYVLVRDLVSKRKWTIGAGGRCHGFVGPPSWSADGSKILFTYPPPGRLPAVPLPQGACQQWRPGEIAIVPAQRTGRISRSELTPARRGCGYDAASYDRTGVIAIEVCGPIDPSHDTASLVQLNPKLRPVSRTSLPAEPNGTSVSVNARTGKVLVYEFHGHFSADVWIYADHHLRRVVEDRDGSDLQVGW